jgi:hypothetical protein
VAPFIPGVLSRGKRRKIDKQTSLAFAAETQIIAATTIKLQLDEITTHPSRWRADLTGNARYQKIKDRKQSQSLRKPIRRAKQRPNDRYVALPRDGADVP